MRFTSEQRLDDGVLEREFTLGEIPGVLWTPGSAPAPLILSGHNGGLHKRLPRLVARPGTTRRSDGKCGRPAGVRDVDDDAQSVHLGHHIGAACAQPGLHRPERTARLKSWPFHDMAMAPSALSAKWTSPTARTRRCVKQPTAWGRVDDVRVFQAEHVGRPVGVVGRLDVGGDGGQPAARGRCLAAPLAELRSTRGLRSAGHHHRVTSRSPAALTITASMPAGASSVSGESAGVTVRWPGEALEPVVAAAGCRARGAGGIHRGRRERW